MNYPEPKEYCQICGEFTHDCECDFDILEELESVHLEEQSELERY